MCSKYIYLIIFVIITINNDTSNGDFVSQNTLFNMTKEYPIDIFQAVNDAGHVFSNVIGKMIANKRLVGLDF
ncbi:unnamed protein product [Colias eurytheme]|nr:unnamed protein product [Colias eurytheme]